MKKISIQAGAVALATLQVGGVALAQEDANSCLSIELSWVSPEDAREVTEALHRAFVGAPCDTPVELLLANGLGGGFEVDVLSGDALIAMEVGESAVSFAGRVRLAVFGDSPPQVDRSEERASTTSSAASTSSSRVGATTPAPELPQEPEATATSAIGSSSGNSAAPAGGAGGEFQPESATPDTDVCILPPPDRARAGAIVAQLQSRLGALGLTSDVREQCEGELGVAILLMDNDASLRLHDANVDVSYRLDASLTDEEQVERFAGLIAALLGETSVAFSEESAGGIQAGTTSIGATRPMLPRLARLTGQASVEPRAWLDTGSEAFFTIGFDMQHLNFQGEDYDSYSYGYSFGSVGDTYGPGLVLPQVGFTYRRVAEGKTGFELDLGIQRRIYEGGSYVISSDPYGYSLTTLSAATQARWRIGRGAPKALTVGLQTEAEVMRHSGALSMGFLWGYNSSRDFGHFMRNFLFGPTIGLQVQPALARSRAARARNPRAAERRRELEFRFTMLPIQTDGDIDMLYANTSVSWRFGRSGSASDDSEE